MKVRNGIVGDWRLGDEEFMAAFRLPQASEKLDTLQRKNPMPGDSRICFDEATHTYTVDGIKVPCSVTALVRKFSSGFDARAHIERMRSKESWSRVRHAFLRENGTEMSVEEIMKRWEANGVVQRSRGTLLHYHAEQFLNGALIEEPRSPEFDRFVELHRSVLSTSKHFGRKFR